MKKSNIKIEREKVSEKHTQAGIILTKEGKNYVALNGLYNTLRNYHGTLADFCQEFLKEEHYRFENRESGLLSRLLWNRTKIK